MVSVGLSEMTHLQRHLRALAAGDSVFVRTATAYPGDAEVTALVARLTGAPLCTSDLASPPVTAGLPTGRGPQIVALRTSGSTGIPKTVVYDAERVRAHARLIARVLGLDPGVRHLALTPPTFAFGLSIVHSHGLADVPVHFLPGPHAPTELARVLAEDPIPTTLYCLPQQASLLAAAPSLGSLRRLVVAGGRLAEPVCRALAARVPDLVLTSMYGQAELGPRLAVWHGPAADFRAGSLGDPLPGVSLQVAEDGGLIARTPHPASWILTAGDPQPRPGARPGEPVRTGDLARVRADGTLEHTGRADSWANVAGTKLDLGALAAAAESRLPVLAVRTGRRSAAAGDDIPVLELVPAAEAGLTTVAVRRALAGVVGSLAALVDIRIVDHLEVGEAGK